jgi:hypothetical protein
VLMGRRTRAEPQRLKRGDYSWTPDFGWCGRCPDGGLANLNGHAVTEHPDLTITVAPSIECRGHRDKETAKALGRYWHGFLVAGVWHDA